MNDYDRLQLMNEIVGSTMLDLGRIVNILHLLKSTEHLGGCVAEFGVYLGRTAALMASVTDRPMHLFDSFEGLPSVPIAEGAAVNFQQGKLLSSPIAVNMEFDRWKLPRPTIHKGWFADLEPDDWDCELNPFTFVHIDCDLEDSTWDALEFVWSNLHDQAVVVLDDYGWNGLPGVQRAVDEFFRGRQTHAIRLFTTREDSHQAYFVPR